jgi:hypothetical protein
VVTAVIGRPQRRASCHVGVQGPAWGGWERPKATRKWPAAQHPLGQPGSQCNPCTRRVADCAVPHQRDQQPTAACSPPQMAPQPGSHLLPSPWAQTQRQCPGFDGTPVCRRSAPLTLPVPPPLAAPPACARGDSAQRLGGVSAEADDAGQHLGGNGSRTRRVHGVLHARSSNPDAHLLTPHTSHPKWGACTRVPKSLRLKSSPGHP